MNDKERCDSPLEAAEADLRAARAEMAAAEREIGNAEVAIEKAIEEERRQFRVEVIYDGVKKAFEVRIEEKVKKLLEQAIQAFGSPPNPHMLSIWKGGTELGDSQTMKEAGVEPCDVLLLRPSKVKGGV